MGAPARPGDAVASLDAVAPLDAVASGDAASARLPWAGARRADECAATRGLRHSDPSRTVSQRFVTRVT